MHERAIVKRSSYLINWGSAFDTLTQRFGPLPAVCSPSGDHTYGSVIGRAASVAAALRSAAVQPGDPVATFLPNEAHAVWASIGVVLSGAAEASLNAAMGPSELKYCLDLLKARHVIADDSTAPIVRAAGYKPLRIEELGARSAPIDRNSPVAGDIWGRLLFTSGTTGKPRAIAHSHQGRWIANLMLRSSLPFQPAPQSRVLLMTPYSHGASLLASAFLDSGGSIYLMNGVQLDLIRDLLSSGQIDSMFAPPTVLAKLTSALDNFSCRTLHTIFTGTASLSPALYGRVREMFGPVVRVTYGKTEMFNPITVLPPADVDVAYAVDGGGVNLGWPAAGVEIQIRDEQGAVCPAGTPGQVFLRSPHMMVGYVDGAGAHDVAPHDWHESGDIGALTTRGELMLIGRENDVIKTGGYKLFPQEIEAPLAAAHLADDIVAVGVPSEYWGQFVVVVAERPKQDWNVQAAKIAEALSRHKRPRAYVAVPEFPRNAQGKLQRAKVLEMLLKDYRVEDGPHPQLRRI